MEKVDRKTIITAESLMFKKNTTLEVHKDGPKGAVRKMRSIAVDQLPVIDEQKKFLGHVWLKDILALEKEKAASIETAIKTNVPSVYKHYTVEEMLPLITGIRHPLAVIEEETGKFLGQVTQTSLIIEATRFEKSDVIELKEIANEL